MQLNRANRVHGSSPGPAWIQTFLVQSGLWLQLQEVRCPYCAFCPASARYCLIESQVFSGQHYTPLVFPDHKHESCLISTYDHLDWSRGKRCKDVLRSITLIAWYVVHTCRAASCCCPEPRGRFFPDDALSVPLGCVGSSIACSRFRCDLNAIDTLTLARTAGTIKTSAVQESLSIREGSCDGCKFNTSMLMAIAVRVLEPSRLPH
jgi:hypothetical protein